MPCTCTGTSAGQESPNSDTGRQEWISSAPLAPVRVWAEALGRHDAEGEARVDHLGAERFGRGDTPLHDGVETGLARVADAVLQGVEGVPFVEVWHVDGVPCSAQFVREGLHPGGEPLSVVEQHDFGHGLLAFDSLNDP